MHTRRVEGEGTGRYFGWAELDGKFSSMQVPTLHNIITVTDKTSCTDCELCAQVLYSK